MKLRSASPAYPFPRLDLDAARVAEIFAVHEAVVKSGVRYRLGAKVSPLGLRPGQFKAVDCSGYVRYLLARVGIPFPDGSAVQHEAVRRAGLKRSDAAALALDDGALRVAFLPPLGGESGHVALWLGGRSIESHGGKGPDRRAPAECGWLAHASVYVLTPPAGVG